MNPDDPFEEVLRRDIAATPRHDPTAAWKTDILARALQGAESLPKARRKVLSFPRLMLAAWAACWGLALLLRFMTPASSGTLVTGVNPPVHDAEAADWHALQNRRAVVWSLLASHDTSTLSRP